MGNAVRWLPWMLLFGSVTAQEVGAERAPLPNWLTGIIAVAVFLFLVLVAFLVNKVWCENSSKKKTSEVSPNEYTMTNGSNTNLDSVRSDDHHEAYENITAL